MLYPPSYLTLRACYYQQYSNVDAENNYKLLEGSGAVATQV